jgi:hypothetical protein
MIRPASFARDVVNRMNSRPAAAMILLSTLVSAGAFAGEPSLEELWQRCEAAREFMLAPLREQAIQDCVSRPRSTRNRAQCEAFYRDFGQGGGTVGGGFRAPMFIGVPECQEYFAEQDRQNSARGRSRR